MRSVNKILPIPFLVLLVMAMTVSSVQGVVMAGLPEHTITNEHGAYTAAVPSLWSGTVTPTLIVHTFDPPSKT